MWECQSVDICLGSSLLIVVPLDVSTFAGLFNLPALVLPFGK